MNLFDQLLIYYSNKPDPFTITHGIAYGHRMLIILTKNFEKTQKRIIEIDDNHISIEGNSFHMSCETFEETIKIFGAIQ